MEGNPQYEVIPKVRYSQGYKMGMKDAESIIGSLARDSGDPNHIIESIKLVTNSMGAAYERGFHEH